MTSSEPEGREQWEKNMLSSLRAKFKIFGDRRDGRNKIRAVVAQYGDGMPAMACRCGEMMSWEEWPDHWRDNHGSQ